MVEALVDVYLRLLDLAQILVARIYLRSNRLDLCEHAPQTLQLAGDSGVAAHRLAAALCGTLGGRALRDA